MSFLFHTTNDHFPANVSATMNIPITLDWLLLQKQPKVFYKLTVLRLSGSLN